MKEFETPLAWALCVAFLAYLILTNCCSDSSTQSILAGDNMNINTPALTTKHVNLNLPAYPTITTVISLKKEWEMFGEMVEASYVDTITVEEDEIEDSEE